MYQRDYPTPPNEAARQAALERYGVLDTPPERFYDDACLLATAVCGTPIAMVSLIDNERQWFKARTDIDATETHRKDAFCAYTIMTPEKPMVITDAAANERFARSALVSGVSHVRFYASVPLVTHEGYALGAVSVTDNAPRVITPEQLTALEALARTVTSHLEKRLSIADLECLLIKKEAHLEELQENQQLLEEASTRYRQESLFDPITDGPNRRACKMYLEAEHQRPPGAHQGRRRSRDGVPNIAEDREAERLCGALRRRRVHRGPASHLCARREHYRQTDEAHH